MNSGFETNFVESLPPLCSGVLLDAAAFSSVPNNIILFTGIVYIYIYIHYNGVFDKERGERERLQLISDEILHRRWQTKTCKSAAV